MPAELPRSAARLYHMAALAGSACTPSPCCTSGRDPPSPARGRPRLAFVNRRIASAHPWRRSCPRPAATPRRYIASMLSLSAAALSRRTASCGSLPAPRPFEQRIAPVPSWRSSCRRPRPCGTRRTASVSSRATPMPVAYIRPRRYMTWALPPSPSRRSVCRKSPPSAVIAPHLQLARSAGRHRRHPLAQLVHGRRRRGR